MTLAPTSSRGGTSGALALIASTTLGAPGTFDVSGIAQTYNDLLLVGIVRGTAAVVNDALLLRFNADAGANYHSQVVVGNNLAGSGGRQTAGTAMWACEFTAAASAGAGIFTPFEVWIPGYASTTWQKATHGGQPFFGSDIDNGANAVYGMGQWLSTAAINRVQIFGSTAANLATGSTLRVYGLT